MSVSLEVPRQPSSLDPIDESTLALIGHRIEGWESLKNKAISLEDRLVEFIKKTELELDAIGGFDVSDNLTPEQDTLHMDLKYLSEVEHTEESIQALAQEKVEYYKAARAGYIREIQ